MHEAQVNCDKCGSPAPLETFNGNSNFRMPSGWVTISPHVQVHGEREDKGEKAWDFKARLKNLVPKYHLCPRCTEDPNRAEREEKKRLAAEEKARLAEIEEAQRLKTLTEPVRKLVQAEG